MKSNAQGQRKCSGVTWDWMGLGQAEGSVSQQRTGAWAGLARGGLGRREKGGLQGVERKTVSEVVGGWRPWWMGQSHCHWASSTASDWDDRLAPPPHTQWKSAGIRDGRRWQQRLWRPDMWEGSTAGDTWVTGHGASLLGFTSQEGTDNSYHPANTSMGELQGSGTHR